MAEKKKKTTELNAEAVEEAVTDVEVTEQTPKQAETADERTTPPPVPEVKGRWWIKYLVTFVVLAVFTVLVAWLRGAFNVVSSSWLADRNITELQCRMQQWSDAFFVPGVLGLGFGLLIVASNGGTFDMLAYGFKAIFRVMKRDVVDRKYGSFYDYRKARQQKKRSFWYLVIIGGLFTLIGGLFTLLFYTV